MSKTSTAPKPPAPEVEFGDVPDLVSTYRDDDFVETAEAAELEDDGWDGRFTPIKLAFGPVMRDLYTLWPGDPCIGHAARLKDGVHPEQRIPCPVLDEKGKPTREHQFHIAASKGRDGKYLGPEADHLRRLIGHVTYERAAPKVGSTEPGEVVKIHVSGGYVAGTRVAQQRSEQFAAMMATRGTDQSIMNKAQQVQMMKEANTLGSPAELQRIEQGERRDESKRLAEKNQEMLTDALPAIAAAVADAVLRANKQQQPAVEE